MRSNSRWIVGLLVIALCAVLSPASAEMPEGDDQTDQAATFAIRAIAQAGLLNPADQYYGYDGILRFEDHWVIQFRSSTCYRTEAIETCDPNTGTREDQHSDAWLRLELHGDRLVVADAWGRFTDEQKQSLFAYSEPSSIEPTHMEFPTVVIRRSLHDDAYDITGAMLWAGPLFVPGVWSVCVPTVHDSEGNVMWEGTPFAFGTRPGEYFRSNGLMGTGVAFKKLDGEPASATLPCELWTQETWVMDGQPEIEREEGKVQVFAPLLWEHGKVGGLDSRCQVTLLNGSEETLKEKVVRGPSSPWAGSTRRQILFEELKVDRPRQVRSVEVRCLAKGQSFN